MTQCNKYSIARSKDFLESTKKEVLGSEKVVMRRRQLNWFLQAMTERSSTGELHARVRQGSRMAESHSMASVEG